MENYNWPRKRDWAILAVMTLIVLWMFCNVSSAQPFCEPSECLPGKCLPQYGNNTFQLPSLQQPRTFQQPQTHYIDVPFNENVVQISYAVGRITSYCSGVTLDHEGLITILTCGHLFRDEKPNGKFVVRFGNETRHYAWLLGYDHRLDLALLAVSRPHIRGIKLALGPPMVGEVITTWGWTHRQPQTITQGPILYYDENHNTNIISYLRARGVSSPGRSGGPILDSTGKIVSILWGSSSRGIQGVRFEHLQFFLRKVLGRYQREHNITPNTTPSIVTAEDLPPVKPLETPENGLICPPNGLRELIRENTQAIAALIAREPLQGKQGGAGLDGIDGEDGQDGEKGEIGEIGKQGGQGDAGPVFKLSDVTDEEVLAFAKRLPPIMLQTIKPFPEDKHSEADKKRIADIPPGGVIQETRGHLGGTPLRLKLVPVSPKERN